MGAKKVKFPKQLYVRRDTGIDDDEEVYFLTDVEMPEVEVTEDCAVYELVSVGKVQVTRTFIEA
jgi:hypothetical protein